MTATLQKPQPRAASAVSGSFFREPYAPVIGGLFLAGFLFYGSGFAIASSVTGDPDFIRSLSEKQTLLTIGVVLMLLNTFIDIGKGVLFYPVLEPHGRRTALVYLAALVAQVVLLDVGGLFLLMLVPIGDLAVGSGAAFTDASVLAPVLTHGSHIAYNTGQAVLSFGGFFLCVLLYRTALVPRALAAVGIAGYVLHAIGSFAELFGVPVSTLLLIPGGIFELSLAFWLIIKGFRAVEAPVSAFPGAVHINAENTCHT